MHINREDNTIDLQDYKRHDLTWEGSKTYRKVYEYDVQMPIEQPDQDCINFGLPIEDQIFRCTYVPKQVLNPGVHYGEESWTEEQIDNFIDTEYYRRKNGVWMYIKGDKYWIPGPLYVFQNYWPLQSGEKAIYRFTTLELWWIWIDTCRDDKLDGLIDFKCRQIGDTEAVIFMIWEYSSRVRNTKCALQSCVTGQIEKTFDRLAFSHNEVIWFFKPINRGADTPAKGLEMKYPTEIITKRKIQEQLAKSGTTTQPMLDYEYPQINSEILFGPSKAGHFDGQTYGRYYLDEFGKADEMNPVETIRTIVPAINSRILDRKVGKVIATSTIEDLKSGRSLKWAMQLWEQAKVDPETGTSLNGLRRIYRSALDRAPADHWGFPQAERELKMIKDISLKFLLDGDMIGKMKHERANPITVQQMFASANDESQFDIEKLAKRQHYLSSEEYINPRTGTNLKPWVRGNLRWKDDNKDSGEAIWEPNSKGRWLISAHPKDHGLKENAKVQGIFRHKPGNNNYYRCGIDPYEQKKTITDDWSMGGIAVKRVLDEFIDGKEDRYYQFNDESRGIKAGYPVDGGINFETNRYCCTYLYRHPNPEDFYEDCILTCLYYGTEMLPEKNRASGLIKHFEDRKYDMYKMDGFTLSKNAKGKSEEDGVTATDKSINEYFGYLMTLSVKWANTIDHPDILAQLLTMNWKNRGEKDLGVAVGWCEYACKVPVFYKKKTQEQKSSTYYTEHYV